MFVFLRENLATIIVVLIIAVLVFFALFKLIKDKKRGKTSCGGNCAGCAMRNSCHDKKKQ